MLKFAAKGCLAYVIVAIITVMIGICSFASCLGSVGHAMVDFGHAVNVSAHTTNPTVGLRDQEPSETVAPDSHSLTAFPSSEEPSRPQRGHHRHHHSRY